MRSKLAFRNAARSIKDYAVYFITLVFAVCVFYMFNSVYAQQAMLGLTETMSASVEALQKILSYISAFVAVILGFLIVYANSYFIKRRKKEMGIYLILGMEKTDISAILLLETSIVAINALMVGLLSGVLLSQLMSVFTAKIFEIDMTRFAFVFSISALVKSVLCFLLIFVVVILFNINTVSRYKLIDLITGNKRNQSLKVRDSKLGTVVFAASLLMLAAAYYLIVTNGLMSIGIVFLAAIFLGGIGTLLFFYSLAGLITNTLQKRKGTYFKNLNMFVIRQLGSNIKTNFISISIVSIILMFAIGVFSTGYGLKDALTRELNGYAGYDFSFLEDANEESGATASFAKLKEFIADNTEDAAYYCFPLYSSDFTYADFQTPLTDDIATLADDYPMIVALADYNASMALQGVEPLSLSENEYALVSNFTSMNLFSEDVVENDAYADIAGYSLAPKQAIAASIVNGFNAAFIIVPDRCVTGLTCVEEKMNLILSNMESTKDFEALLEGHNNDEANSNRFYYVSRSRLAADAMEKKASLSFITLYLGIVFLITCAAILAIQQLTEAEDNKARYALLRKLGAEKKMMNKALFTQILCYFMFPLGLGIIHAGFGMIAAVNTLLTYAEINIAKSGSITALFVLALYAVYFFITYVGSKNIIQKN